jgi:type II secretory pathway pseudopilin PulG
MRRKPSTGPGPANAGEAGFTLLEAIVALLILALALGTAVQSVAMASNRLVMADHARSIERVAKRVLAFQASVPDTGQVTTGIDAETGFKWTLDRRLVPLTDTQAEDGGKAMISTLAITSGGTRRQTFTFRSLSFAEPDK